MSPTPSPSPASAGGSANPYPGLRPFEEREEHLFFGRERQIDRMIDILAERRFLAVVGGSGSGKSSLVNCGLQPALRRGLMARGGTAWRMARFRPGLRPIDALAEALADALAPRRRPSGERAAASSAAALAAADLSLSDVIATELRLSRLGLVEAVGHAGLSADTQLLVVVDQFEEIFRYQALAEGSAAAHPSADLNEAQALVNLLLAAAAQPDGPVHLVLTMRSDFLGDCAQFPGLPEAITASLHLVPRLSREERRQAIAMPALVGGAEVDPALLTQLVNDVGDDPDQLSILQHALRRTWHHWQQRGGQGPLTLADYEAIGTMATALDSHAEQALAEVAEGAAGDGLGSANLSLSSRLFRALTDKATDPRGIRRPTTLAELQAICGGDPAAVERLVDHYRQADRAFLMPPEGERLHPDSVVDISHESLMRVWRRLDRWADQEAAAAALFLRLADAAQRHDRGEASLWRDPELQLALDWRQREQPTEAWGQRYAANHHQAFAFLTASRAAREAERRQLEWRRRRTLMGLAAFSLVATGVGAFSWWQWHFTELSHARAYAATAAATLEQRPLQSMLFSLAALERLAKDPAEALGAAATLARAALRNWELEQWEINPGNAGHQRIFTLLALRDGRAISASGCGAQTTAAATPAYSCLQLWRGSSAIGALVPSLLRGAAQEVTALLELRDGRLLSGVKDGTLHLWQVEPSSLKPVAPSPAAGGNAASTEADSAQEIHSLVQLSDGEIVSGDSQGTLRRWRLVGQGEGSRLEPVGAPIATGVDNTVLLALPDGALLSGGADPGQQIGGAGLQLWRQGKPIGGARRTGQSVVKQLLLWNDQVLSLGSEGTVVRFNPATGSREATPTPFGRSDMGSNVERLAVVAGGRALVSLHSDGSLRLWQAASRAKANGDGKGKGANDGVLELLARGQADSKDLPLLTTLRDGRLLAADSNDRMHLIRVPDPRSGELERSGALSSGDTAVNSLVALSDDRLVSGAADKGRICFWDLAAQPQRLSVQLKGSSTPASPCLSGTLGGADAQAQASDVLLAPLPSGELLSATNLGETRQGESAVVLQRWRPEPGGRAGAWTVERRSAPAAWGRLNLLAPAASHELLAFGMGSGLWRWNPLQPEAAARQLQVRQQTGGSKEASALDWWRAVALPGGDWLSAGDSGGTLQRWRAGSTTSLQPSATIETGLESIGALALLPGGRYAVIASGQQSQEAGQVQVFDLQEGVWVGQPIPVPRPFNTTDGTVAATALAALPGGGLAIGLNTERGNLLVIQPRRIQQQACRSLKPLLASGSLLQRSRSGMPPGVRRLSRRACGA